MINEGTTIKEPTNPECQKIWLEKQAHKLVQAKFADPPWAPVRSTEEERAAREKTEADKLRRRQEAGWLKLSSKYTKQK